MRLPACRCTPASGSSTGCCARSGDGTGCWSATGRECSSSSRMVSPLTPPPLAFADRDVEPGRHRRRARPRSHQHMWACVPFRQATECQHGVSREGRGVYENYERPIREPCGGVSVSSPRNSCEKFGGNGNPPTGSGFAGEGSGKEVVIARVRAAEVVCARRSVSATLEHLDEISHFHLELRRSPQRNPSLPDFKPLVAGQLENRSACSPAGR